MKNTSNTLICELWIEIKLTLNMLRVRISSCFIFFRGQNNVYPFGVLCVITSSFNAKVLVQVFGYTLQMEELYKDRVAADLIYRLFVRIYGIEI